jgi:hypothetical protein
MPPLLRGLVALVVVVALLVLGGFLWIALGPGPMDFAGRNRVALAAYHAADPTGAPPDLAKAGVIERGQYLARAAD